MNPQTELALAWQRYEASLEAWHKSAMLGQLGDFATRQAKDKLDTTFADCRRIAQQILEEEK